MVYNLPALEKHIVDRFIHGKPEIDVNIPVISFKTDVVQTTGFAKVRKSIPQVNISYSGIQLPSHGGGGGDILHSVVQIVVHFEINGIV